MAEPIGGNAGLDGRLRDAFAQAAAPGDSTGVADAIRSRLAAGDPGASAVGPVAPGWGRRLFGMLAGGILLGLVIVGGTATGVGLALTGDGGREPSAEPSVQVSPTASPTPTPTPTASPTPTPPPIQPPAPAPVPDPAPPPPAADTTSPTVQASANPAMLFSMNGTGTTITAVAQDAVGVTQVAISWSGYAAGSAAMSPAGGGWTFAFDLPADAQGGSGQIDFVVTARDAAGNAASTVVTVPVSP
ncbi:hypothetical protein [Pseudolysinimonas sp.]|jgi:hypothetical protein|uniref:hypothetical protein n=1 Tax=Pseudolysinimonas sp. TaxID=2680009 RepID=UPI0037850658